MTFVFHDCFFHLYIPFSFTSSFFRVPLIGYIPRFLLGKESMTNEHAVETCLGYLEVLRIYRVELAIIP